MAINKQKKTEILAELERGLAGAETTVFVNFHGLTVKETTELRKKLRSDGVSYYVAKKTLVKRALATKGVNGTLPDFPGELAVAWAADPIAAPKGVAEFAKGYKEKVTLVGGIYQGSYMSKEEINVLASIPTRLELYSMFAGLLNTSIANVVRVIDAKAKKMEEAPAV